MQAKGTFEVRVTPEPVLELEQGAVGQFRATKTFVGDLVGTSTVWMLTAGDQRAGEAGYAAMEMVKGTLGGKTGTFALQHSSTMTARGGIDIRIVVTPGSGTGELTGLSGTFVIDIREGQHLYSFEYSLP
jgi:hypothetical protein